MKTFITKKSDIKRVWHLIDAKDQILGRLASRIAQLLIGKNKVYFTPSLDCGDWVVVINAQKIRLTGRKSQQKVYRFHSNYPGGFKELTFKQMMEKDPKKVIRLAVGGMLPKNKLRDQRLARLKIFINEKHNYEDKFKNLKNKPQ